MTITTPHVRLPRPGSRVLAVRAATGTTTAVAGALLLLLTATTTGQALQVQVGARAAQNVTVGVVASTILLCGVAAWGTAALVCRVAPAPRLAFLAPAVLLLALSFVPPATAATGAATWWLEAMHLVVFTSVVAALAPAIPLRRPIASRPLEVPAHGGAA